MLPTAELLHRLCKNPWFASLPVDIQEQLVKAGDPLTVRTGEMLLRQGDVVRDGDGAFYGLLRGHLKMSSMNHDGREAILAVLEPGNWFGEVSLIDGRPRIHDVTALVGSQVLIVRRPAFDALMREPAFTRGLCDLLASRTRAALGMVEDATLRSTRARVARRLLQLARGDITLDANARTLVRVSQEALAMMLGLTRQTLSKELRALVEAGSITVGYGRVEITSLEALERLGRDE